MAQIGVIVIKEGVNAQAFVDLLKEDKKLTIGSTETTENGVKYIPINKNG